MFEDSQIKCNMDLRGLKNLTTIGHWGCGRWEMQDNDIYLPSSIRNLTWESFNGSRIRDLYWNIDDPSSIQWGTFDEFYNGISDWITKELDNVINVFFSDSAWREMIEQWLNDEIQRLKYDLVQEFGDTDHFIFGNTVIRNIYTSESGIGFFTDNVGTDSSTETYSSNYPQLFWELGMADCPKEKIVDNILLL
jgi:hypothetical protein